MKTPLYEVYPGALESLLVGSVGIARTFRYTDLYTIECVGGYTLRYVSSDTDWGYGGNVWRHGLVQVDDKQQKALAHWKIGLNPDQWIIYFYPRYIDPVTQELYPDLVAGVPFEQAARGGVLDNALVTIERAYIGDAPNPIPAMIKPVGTYRIFVGTVGVVDIGYGVVVVTIDSLVKLLTTNVPVNLFQYGCAHTLFGPGCDNAGSLPQASFANNATVTSSSLSPPSIIAAGLPPAPSGSGTFTLGKVQITSGPNTGFWRMVMDWNGVTKTLTISAPFPFPINNGDTLVAYPGCDKTRTSCNKYNNILNYGGEPDIPVPELAV